MSRLSIEPTLIYTLIQLLVMLKWKIFLIDNHRRLLVFTDNYQ